MRQGAAGDEVADAEERGVKLLKHPATVIASVALFLALGGGAAAYASGLISGSQIRNHSIPAKKLTKRAIRSLHGKRGLRGPAGPTGPQGPGGKIVTYDATAKASPTTTPLGTFLGDTISASCKLLSGDAVLTVYVQTSGNGSWNADYSWIANNNGTVTSNARKIADPAGTLSTAKAIETRTANSGGHEADARLDFLQIAPSPGSMTWHETASTKNATQTCHLLVQSFPETLTAVSG
jgi:hypothetical protein